MPEQLDPSTAAQKPRDDSNDEQENLRLLSRSPHPYARQKFELLEPSGSFAYPPRDLALRASLDDKHPQRATTFPSITRDTSASSDSGTEADDEHFLKGLPAPRARLHKGLRGRNELVSGTSTPLPSPGPFDDDDGRRHFSTSHAPKKEVPIGKHIRTTAEKSRRNKEIVRRLAEVLLLGSLGVAVYTNKQARPALHQWRLELIASLGIMGTLVLLYPLRLIIWGYRHRSISDSPPTWTTISIPTAFDPAPLLYPPAITLLVSSLISMDNQAILLPNIILALCSLPASLFFASSQDSTCNSWQWLVTCIPLFLSSRAASLKWADSAEGLPNPQLATLLPETVVLLYPLHQHLCRTLHSLTTTSLLTAELQLLSVALINVLLTSSSPQAVIIKGMLWVGGLDLLILGTNVITWGISLARVPKWRFKRAVSTSKRSSSFLAAFLLTALSWMPWKIVRHDLFHAPMDSSSCSSCEAIEEAEDSESRQSKINKPRKRRQSAGLNEASIIGLDAPGIDATSPQEVRFSSLDAKRGASHLRRHTLSSVEHLPRKSYTHTPSGRKKRSASTSVRAFFSLTYEQATWRKWLYALYVYILIIGAVFIPHKWVGVKDFVQTNALHNFEPVGWALGYLFGDQPRFRFEVVSRNLEWWICLPTRPDVDDISSLDSGWVQHLRHAVIGEANTRLLLSGYYLAVIGVGLAVVLRLSPVYEVDTRRKVFHFMMVAMFAPSIYVDPTFAGLALSIVLAVFLLLDLLRASQLPPLSKPLAAFLAPYVDGRDLRGPVVISHIFLLIGCAIPLWLSLGSLPRSGTGYLEGWEVPTREVSMVAGVICVGLGDAAASLIGRRYGHRKWLWGGGKSLEGSVAFALAVFMGLLAAHAWLRIGGWPSSTEIDSVGSTMSKAGFCASMASLTEAVLTGGNDNVVVPVVLWTCVKSLAL
ncbi:ClpP/crotonase-like domain-containing protein [Apiospora arundinis]